MIKKSHRDWTMREVESLKRNYNYFTQKEIAKHLNRSLSSVRYKINELGLRKQFVQEYAVYKNGEIITVGTDEECAKALGVSKEYIRFMTTPTAKRRIEKLKNPELATTAVKLEREWHDVRPKTAWSLERVSNKVKR